MRLRIESSTKLSDFYTFGSLIKGCPHENVVTYLKLQRVENIRSGAHTALSEVQLHWNIQLLEPHCLSVSVAKFISIRSYSQQKKHVLPMWQPIFLVDRCSRLPSQTRWKACDEDITTKKVNTCEWEKEALWKCAPSNQADQETSPVIPFAHTT